MNAGGCANYGARRLALSEVRRGAVEELPEDSAEGFVRIIAGIQSDLHHGCVAGVEGPGGPFEPESTHERRNRLTEHTGENTVKVEGR